MLYVASFLGITYLTSRASLSRDYERTAQKRAKIIMILMLLFMGLRHATVFGDAVTYVAAYQYRLISWKGLAILLQTEREPLYTLLVFICQHITRNYTFFFFVTSFPVVYGFSRLMKDYSPDPFMSILLFCGLGCMYFSMAGLRQAIAMGVTMLAFPYAKQRKLIPFLLLCLVAYGFHNSSIIFVFVYFVINWKPNWKMWIAIAIAMILGMSRNPIVIRLANIFTTKEYEMDKEGLNYSMLIIQLFILAFCYVFGYLNEKRDYSNDHSMNRSLLLMGFIGAVFQAFTPIKGEFFRVSLYFSTYLTLSVPATIRNIRNSSTRQIMSIGIVAVLLLYIFALSGMKSYRPFFAG